MSLTTHQLVVFLISFMSLTVVASVGFALALWRGIEFRNSMIEAFKGWGDCVKELRKAAELIANEERNRQITRIALYLALKDTKQVNAFVLYLSKADIAYKAGDRLENINGRYQLVVTE